MFKSVEQQVFYYFSEVVKVFNNKLENKSLKSDCRQDFSTQDKRYYTLTPVFSEQFLPPIAKIFLGIKFKINFLLYV